LPLRPKALPVSVPSFRELNTKHAHYLEFLDLLASQKKTSAPSVIKNYPQADFSTLKN
jgi:hypothetical protein